MDPSPFGFFRYISPQTPVPAKSQMTSGLFSQGEGGSLHSFFPLFMCFTQKDKGNIRLSLGEMCVLLIIQEVKYVQGVIFNLGCRVEPAKDCLEIPVSTLLLKPNESGSLWVNPGVSAF